MKLKKIWHELNYLRFTDIVAIPIFLFSIVPAIFFKCIVRVKKKKIWLICEDKMEARDNGFCFFEFLCKDKVDVLPYYAINYKSADLKKVKCIGKTVRYGSVWHWMLYFACEYNISSQKGGKPNAAIGYVLDRMNIGNKKFVFLQHGITINKAEWLYYDNAKIGLFICAAKPEYEYITKYFGYPKGSVQYLGFSRFDEYHSKKADKNKILLIPSWREWIGSKNEYTKIYEEGKDFADTEYYIKYQSLINNEELIKKLEREGIFLYFYPHRNMQKFIDFFKTRSQNIKIVNNKNSDIRKLLIDCSLMITDYSSVALDFAYMKKPVIYYQFDEFKFFEAQYDKGYYDYKNAGLGKVTKTEEETVALISNYIDSVYTLDEDFENAHRDFFAIYDSENSRRIFKCLREQKKIK